MSRENFDIFIQRYRYREDKSKAFFYTLMADLTYRFLLIGVKDQWAAKSAERFVQMIQREQVFHLNKTPLSDDQVSDEITSYVNRNCPGNAFHYQDFRRVVGPILNAEADHE